MYQVHFIVFGPHRSSNGHFFSSRSIINSLLFMLYIYFVMRLINSTWYQTCLGTLANLSRFMKFYSYLLKYQVNNLCILTNQEQRKLKIRTTAPIKTNSAQFCGICRGHHHKNAQHIPSYIYIYIWRSEGSSKETIKSNRFISTLFYESNRFEIDVVETLCFGSSRETTYPAYVSFSIFNDFGKTRSISHDTRPTSTEEESRWERRRHRRMCAAVILCFVWGRAG